MTINEQLLTDLVTDTNALRAEILENSAPAFNTLANQGADLAALGPIADKLEANANNIAAIQSAPADAARAATARQEAETAAAEAEANSGVNPIMANAIRNSYSIASRAPSVIADPVDGVYFSANGACDFDNLINHSRNSVASFVDSNGHIQSASTDKPRTENHVLKDGIWQRSGLRVDNQATNLLKHSENFSVSPWQSGEITITTTTAPDGMSTAQRLTGVSGGTCYFGQTVDVGAGFNTFSIFAKVGTDSVVCIRLYNFGTANDRVWFDLATGAVLTKMSGLHTAEIHHIGNGWVRCLVTMIMASSHAGGVVYIYLTDGDNSLSAAGGDILFWGAQFESGSVPTSYIKTGTTAVTREADAFSVPAANLPSSSGGLTFVLEGTIDRFDANENVESAIFYWQKAADERILAWISSTGSYDGAVRARIQNNGMATADSNLTALTAGLDTVFKFSLRFTETEVQTIVNGAATAATSHNLGLPDLTNSNIVSLLSGFTGTLSKLRIFDTALPEAALITETTL